MRRLGYRPELDGIRGIAILLVMLRHTFQPRWWALGGAFGVDVFFALSGFLITSLLLAEWGRSGRISLRSFYVRRARRLLPALGAFLGLIFLLGVALHPSRAPSLFGDALLRLSYVSNFAIAFTRGGVGPGFVHLWSLAEEEQFYLIWPAALIFMLTRRWSPRRMVAAMTALAVLASIERAILVGQGAAGFHRIWYAPDTHADPIIYGSIVGIIWTYRLIDIPRIVPRVSAAAALAIVALFNPNNAGWLAVMLPIFAITSSLALYGVVEHGLARTALASRALVVVGLISYPLYLWHGFTVSYFHVAGIPIAVVLAMLSYTLVEAPFRRARAQKSDERYIEAAPAGANIAA